VVKDVVTEEVRQFVDGALGKKAETSLEVGHRGSEGVGIDSCSSTFNADCKVMGKEVKGEALAVGTGDVVHLGCV